MSVEIPGCLGRFEEDERCQFCPATTRRFCEAVTQDFVKKEILADLVEEIRLVLEE